MSYLGTNRARARLDLNSVSGVPSPSPYTVLLCNFNTTVTDDIGRHTLTAGGNAAISTAAQKWGAGSLLLDGNGDYVSIPNSTDFQFDAGAFTIECWLKNNGGNSYEGWIFDVSGNSGGSSSLVFALQNGKIRTLISSTSGTWDIANSTGSITMDANWNHVAISRSGSNIRAFVNGIEDLRIVSSASLRVPTETTMIGRQGQYTNWLNAYVDDFRVTKGLARYVGDFTPPTRQLSLIYP
jgi:hypothetical protein